MSALFVPNLRSLWVKISVTHLSLHSVMAWGKGSYSTGKARKPVEDASREGWRVRRSGWGCKRKWGWGSHFVRQILDALDGSESWRKMFHDGAHFLAARGWFHHEKYERCSAVFTVACQGALFFSLWSSQLHQAWRFGHFIGRSNLPWAEKKELRARPSSTLLTRRRTTKLKRLFLYGTYVISIFSGSQSRQVTVRQVIPRPSAAAAAAASASASASAAASASCSSSIRGPPSWISSQSVSSAAHLGVRQNASGPRHHRFSTHWPTANADCGHLNAISALLAPYARVKLTSFHSTTETARTFWAEIEGEIKKEAWPDLANRDWQERSTCVLGDLSLPLRFLHLSAFITLRHHCPVLSLLLRRPPPKMRECVRACVRTLQMGTSMWKWAPPKKSALSWKFFSSFSFFSLASLLFACPASRGGFGTAKTRLFSSYFFLLRARSKYVSPWRRPTPDWLSFGRASLARARSPASVDSHAHTVMIGGTDKGVFDSLGALQFAVCTLWHWQKMCHQLPFFCNILTQ